MPKKWDNLDMKKEITPEIVKLLELYKKSTLVKHGAPDEYQYHQNKLLRGIAEHLLGDYLGEDEGEEEE